MQEAHPEGFTKTQAGAFKRITNEIAGLRYDLARPLALENIPVPAERKSTIPSTIVLTARNDYTRSRAIYDAITEAAIGVHHNANTAVDDILEGKSPSVTPRDLYDAFAQTRAQLREHFGDKVTLYRVEGKQREKATKNYATTREGALQYGGPDVVSREVPVSDVIAINPGLSGTYEEIIVGKPPETGVDSAAKQAEVPPHGAEPTAAGAEQRGSFLVTHAGRGDDFARAIARSAAEHPFGTSVTVKPAEFYSDPANKVFLSPDHLAGAVVTPEGELVSVFRHPKGSKEDIKAILREANTHVTKGDAYDIKGGLPSYYAKQQQVPVARVAWDDAFAPPNWDYAAHGRPDVVYMVRDPDGVLGVKGAEDYNKIREKVPLMSYDDAVKAQSEGVERVRRVSRAERAVGFGSENAAYRRLPDTERAAQESKGMEPTVARQVFEQRGQEADLAEALDLIKQVGPEEARRMAEDRTTGMHEAIRSAIYVHLIDAADAHIEEAEKSKDTDEINAAIRDRQALSHAKAPQATEHGQGIAMLGQIGRTVKGGTLHEYIKHTDTEQEAQLGPEGTKATNDFVEGTNAIVKSHVDEMIPPETAGQPPSREPKRPGSLPPALFPIIPVTDSIWTRYRKDAASRIANFVESRIAPPPDRVDLHEFEKRFVEEVRARMADSLPQKEKGQPIPAIKALSDAIKNPEKYQDLADTLRSEMVTRFGEGSPPVDMFDTELANIGVRTYDGRLLGLAGDQAYELAQTKVREVARKHFSDTERLNRSLADALVQQAGLSKEKATALADELSRDMDKRTQAERYSMVQRLIARSLKPQERKVLRGLSRVIDLNNMGALTTPAAREAVARELGLPHADPQQIYRISKLSDAVSQATTVASKARATLALASELRESKRLGHWSKPIDIGTGFWYANLLGGTTTLVKGSWDIMSTADAMLTTMVANPRNAGVLLSGWLHGLSEASMRARAVLTTGRGGVGYDPMAGGYPDKQGKPQPLSNLESIPTYHKYVPRIFKALEVFFYTPAREAYAKLVATKLLQSEYKGAELRREVRDKLGLDPALFEKFRAQAEAEGFTGVDVGLRAGQLIEQHRNTTFEGREGHAAGHRFGKELVLTNEPRGWNGVIYRAFRDTVGDVKPGGLPVLKPFFAFLKVPTNFINLTMNYSPIGIARALKGQVGETIKERYRPTVDERNRLLIQGFVGTALMGGWYAWIHSDDNKDKFFDITASGPKDATKRRQLQQAGWQPHSLKFGDTYVGFGHSPWFLPLEVMGTMSDSAKWGIGQRDEAIFDMPSVDAALRGAAGVFSLPMLTGSSNLMDFVQNKATPQRWNKFAASSLGSLLFPRGAQQVDQVIDPTEYRASGILGALRSQVPFLRRNETPLLGPTGDPMRYSPLGRFVSHEVPGVADELSKMGVFISNEERPKIGPIGHKKAATGSEYALYQEWAGKDISQALSARMSQIKDLPPEEAQKAVNFITATARRNAHIRLENMHHELATSP